MKMKISTMFKKGLYLSLFLSLGYAASAHEIVYKAKLSGPSEAPPNASPALGNVTITLDLDLVTMRVQCTFDGLTGNTTASHIHAATAVGGTGTAGVATTTPTFTGFPLGVTSGTYDHTFDMTLASSYNAAYITAHGGTVATALVDFMKALDEGKAYFNVHTSTFGAGEIRGFLCAVPSAPISSDTTICSGTSVMLKATGVVGGALKWFTAPTKGTEVAADTIFTTSALTADTSYYVQDSTACAISARTEVKVTVKPMPDVLVMQAENTLTVTETAATYLWLKCNGEGSFTGLIGNTDQSYTVPNIDFYAVEVSKNGCVDTSDCQNIIITSLDNSLSSNAFKVYPNPTTDNLTVELNGLENATVTLTNMMGKVVYSQESSKSILISMADKISGIYIIKVKSGETVITKSVVKE